MLFDSLFLSFAYIKIMFITFVTSIQYLRSKKERIWNWDF